MIFLGPGKPLNSMFFFGFGQHRELTAVRPPRGPPPRPFSRGRKHFLSCEKEFEARGAPSVDRGLEPPLAPGPPGNQSRRFPPSDRPTGPLSATGAYGRHPVPPSKNEDPCPLPLPTTSSGHRPCAIVLITRKEIICTLTAIILKKYNGGIPMELFPGQIRQSR